MKWALKLTLLTGDRKILEAVLQALGLRLAEREENSWIAHGPSLDEMGNAGEVHAHGSRIVGRLTELRLHDPTLLFDVNLDGVIRFNANGQEVLDTIILVGTCMTTCTGSLAAAISSETPEAQAAREAEERRLEYERRERLAIAHVVPAVQSSVAATVERLLLMEQSATTLYNILEVIESDGTVPTKKLGSKTKWDLCMRSMCHPVAVGDAARHVASREHPPAKPMHLREARSFVAEVAMAWLEVKAGLRE